VSKGVVAFSSFFSELFIPLSNDLFLDFISFLKKEVGQVVSWVVRNVLAKVDESLGQVRHDLIHQVLTDGLRPLVQKISFVFANLFKLGSFAFLSLTAILGGIFVKKFFLSCFLLSSSCFDFLPLNKGFNFVNV